MPSVFERFNNRLFDPGPINEESVQHNQALADALFAQATTPRNIQHPTQALGMLAQALNSQIFRQRGQKGQEALKAQTAKALGNFMQGLPPEQRERFAALPVNVQQEILPALAAQSFTPREQFEPVTDEQGNILGQRNTLSGRVVDDPRAGTKSPRFDEFDVIGADGSRTTVEGRIGPQGAEVLTRTGQFAPVAQVFPNAARIEPAITRGVQATEPGAFGTPTQRGKLQLEFNDQVAAINSFGAQADRVLEIVSETEGANTLTAALANVGNRLGQEVKTLSNTFGIEFEAGEDAFNPERYAGAFSAMGLAGANARVKNGYLALAIQRAMAAGLGTGRALSDKDIESQLRTLGASQSDPAIIGAIFSDSFKSLHDTARFRAEANQLDMPEIHIPAFMKSGAESIPGYNDLTPAEQAELNRLLEKRSGGQR